jgi:cytidine deaminase
MLPSLDDRAKDELVRAAKDAVEKAYSPYSNIRIGAALLTKGGRVHVGASIGNASSALNSCAEQAALVAAVMNGEREFAAIAVAQANGEPVVPCGRCLQLLSEFADDMLVLTPDGEGRKEWTLRHLQPVPFRRSRGG